MAALQDALVVLIAMLHVLIGLLQVSQGKA
jgi:hypothetical protein